jgi:hypothetical protein
MVRMPAGHLPSPPMEAARLFPEPAAGEPYTILIMLVMLCEYGDNRLAISIYRPYGHSTYLRQSQTSCRKVEFDG